MATSQARIERIRCEAASSKTVGFLMAWVVLVIGTTITLSILLLPVRNHKVVPATVTILVSLVLVVLGQVRVHLLHDYLLVAVKHYICGHLILLESHLVLLEI